MQTRNVTRRDFLKAAGMSAAALAGGALAGCGRAGFTFRPRGSDRPNVLFIAIDDLNDWVGCLGGHPQTQTPNLDRLAERGVLFTNAHCAAPACGPSRAALMTGIHPATSGVYLNSQPFRGSFLLKDAVTLSQHFMAHGYRAVGSGKIFHDYHPDPASWQEYWPSPRKTRPDDPMPPEEKRPLNGFPTRSGFDWGPVEVSKEAMGDWQVADWVIGQLEKNHEAPFFLGCGFYRPHLPWYVPPEYFEKFPLDEIILPLVNENDLDDVPEAGRKMARPEGDHARVIQHNQWKQAVQGYLASIHFVDECVGRVLDAFDRSAYRDNTIIVLWSDHGWHLGEKLHWRKFALWEEATRNVLAFVAPGMAKAGGRCDAAVGLLDIYPTLVELCGLSPRPGLEGVSLAPLLKKPDREWDRPVLTTHGRNNHSVRSNHWRYIRYEDGSEELYDHTNDPLEWTNLAGRPEYAQIKQSLASRLPRVNAEDAPRRPDSRMD